MHYYQVSDPATVFEIEPGGETLTGTAIKALSATPRLQLAVSRGLLKKVTGLQAAGDEPAAAPVFTPPVTPINRPGKDSGKQPRTPATPGPGVGNEPVQ